MAEVLPDSMEWLQPPPQGWSSYQLPVIDCVRLQSLLQYVNFDGLAERVWCCAVTCGESIDSWNSAANQAQIYEKIAGHRESHELHQGGPPDRESAQLIQQSAQTLRRDIEAKYPLVRIFPRAETRPALQALLDGLDRLEKQAEEVSLAIWDAYYRSAPGEGPGAPW